MNWKHVLPVVAAIGYVAAIAAVIAGNKAPPAAPAPLPSAQSPFENYVAGTGLIEASTGNIAIGTPVSGIVDAIYANGAIGSAPASRFSSLKRVTCPLNCRSPTQRLRRRWQTWPRPRTCSQSEKV